MIILSIRESGRTSLIGPMIIAAVSIEEKDEFKLDILGIRDNKEFDPEKDDKLYKGIIEMAKEYKIKIIDINEIDYAVGSDESNLNILEADKVAEFINEIKNDKVIVECPSNNLSEYKDYIKKRLNKDVKVVVEHKVDNKYVAAKAALILAKKARKQQIEKIKMKYKIDFGSGYASDPFTINFLERNYNKYPIFRKSWASWKRVALKKNQKNLLEF